MTLPHPADHHTCDHLVPFSDGTSVTFRLRMVRPSVDEEIQAAGEKRAQERYDSDPIGDGPVVRNDDVAVDYLTAGVVGFYTSENSELVGFDHDLAVEMWADWPPGIKVDILTALLRFSATGKAKDPKAGSTPNANAS